MKDTALYLEVDEDITSAIDKLQKLSGSSVQVVVPKRSTMLQSVINLKLLKKAASDSGKELVLVTNDRVASDLAGRVGLAVAPSLGAKPVLADVAEQAPMVTDDIIEDEGDETPPAPVPAVAKEPEAASEAATPKRPPMFSRREIGDKPVEAPAAAPAAAGMADAADDSSAKPKLPKVPNFKRLQRRLLWAGAAVVLIGGYFLAMYLFTTAKVTLYATATKASIDTTFKVDPNASSSDNDAAVLAGQTVTYTKTLTGPVTPTGKQDIGTKASGTITVSNSKGVDQALVTGTQFAAPDGKVFRSTADVDVPAAHLNASGDKVNGTKSVSVTADQNGDNYNEAPTAYTIPNLNDPKVTAQGAQMSGGTTKTATVLSQSDVDSAKAALLDKDKSDSQAALDKKVPSGYQGLPSSSQQAATAVTPSPAVGQQTDTASVSIQVSYTELAVKKSDFEAYLKDVEQKQVGATNEIYDDGLGAAQITLADKDSTGRQGFHLATDAFSGVKLDKTDIAKQLGGKRYGDASDTASKLPGVQKVDVAISPAWALSLPRASKVTIIIQVADNGS